MKKKLLAGLTALLCCAQMLPVMNVNALDPIMHGDVNFDGNIDIFDIILMNKAMFGKESLDTNQTYAADVDMDGPVDFNDSLNIMRYIVRLIPNFYGLQPTDRSTLQLSPSATNLSEAYTADEITGLEADETFINRQTEFYLDLFQNSAEQSKGENLLVSPYSVSQALAMTANGADGQTKSEMESVLGNDIELEKLNQYLYAQRISQPDTDTCKLSTANSIWIRDGFNVRPDFLQTNANYYGADAFHAPFDDSTVDDINHWIDYHTDNMIPQMLDNIPDNIVMYLINAVAFDGKWETSYQDSDVSKRDFTAYDGTAQSVDMMHSEKEYMYLKDEHAQGFYKYYAGRRYAFAAMLPDEDISIDDYVAGLTPESLHETLANPKYELFSTNIPKFSYEYEIKLNDTLSEMGMPTAFTDAADFSGMSDISLCINEVRHKTFIDVSETGTKAAAVTIIGTEPTSVQLPSFEITLDRPFVYYIVDTETYLPVFMGMVTTIK